MLSINLSSYPSQRFDIVLEGQNCTIDLLTRETQEERLYMNLYVDHEAVQCGAVCLNLVPIIQNPTSLFSGNLLFVDTLGDENPNWSGLDSRYQLIYMTEEELEEYNLG